MVQSSWVYKIGIDQKDKFGVTDHVREVPDDDQFWVVDASIGFRLPKRWVSSQLRPETCSMNHSSMPIRIRIVYCCGIDHYTYLAVRTVSIRHQGWRV